MKLIRILPLFSVILLAGMTLTSMNGAAEQARQSDARNGPRNDLYRKLAYFHAPILFQDTEVRGQSQDEGNPASVDQPIQRRGDFLTRFDFDGDWNGLNNWANFAKRPPADKNKDTMARGFMYYSVVE